MEPDVDRRKSKKRLKACGNALPTDHQAAILLLEPGKCALSLQSWDGFFDRSAPGLCSLPDALQDLRPDTPLPELLPQRLRILPLLRRDPFETFVGVTAFARVHLDSSKQRHHLSTRIPLGWRDAVRQGHAAPLGAAVDEDPLAFPPGRAAHAATLPRGQKRHRRRHTPHASSRVPQPSPASALASRPAGPPPATTATSDASRASTPMAAHAGHRTSGSR